MTVLGLYSCQTTESPSVRAGSLGLLFAGAGLIAVFTIPAIFAFIVSMALIPHVMFAWFGAGGVLFPILLWVGTSELAAFLARDSLLDIAGPVWAVLCVSGVAWITYQTYAANAEARHKRQKRNEYLVEAVKESQAQARDMQWFIELGLTKKDDFSYHDVIDQFQTSAIRCQLYEAVSDLGV